MMVAKLRWIVLTVMLVAGCKSVTPSAKPGTVDVAAKSNWHGRGQGQCVADTDVLAEPVSPSCYSPNENAVGVMAPRTVDELPTNFVDTTIDDVIHWALQNSEVMRDVGGRVLSGPEAATTIHDVAIEYTDPNFGVEAALSAFDANLTSQFSYASNDRVFNNLTLGGGAQELRQDLAQFQTGLTKTAATGTQMNLRSNVFHDRNNRSGNLFGHLWETQWEAELRQPLLQGAGLAFNRIAGPNARPGMRFTNGVVIAQMNNDISKVEFEVAVRGFVSELEEAYWQLYQAYQEYGSRQATRDAAERTWKTVEAKYEQGLTGGEADKEAQARAQFYYYHDLSLEALNGSAATPGVYEAERRLRLLMGLPNNDGELLRPTSTVSDARIVYDWHALSEQATRKRAEVRRQLWKIKQEEYRLVAAKSFLLPRLDATALYRLRGFGDDLVNSDQGRFSSAARDMANLDHQEWQFGLQLDVPIGRRRAYAGLRHAELRLARERSILREQELQVSHELANAIARAVQTHGSMTASRQRVIAAQERLSATSASFEADKVPVDLMLDAQERLGAAEARYYQVVSAHAIAEKNVRLAAGQLLASNGVTLQGDCPAVYCSTPRKRRDDVDYRMQVPCPTSSGPHPQNYESYPQQMMQAELNDGALSL